VGGQKDGQVPFWWGHERKEQPPGKRGTGERHRASGGGRKTRAKVKIEQGVILLVRGDEEKKEAN